ncbi:MAG: alpha/beta fold hydrolase [Candidatus Saccharibacteria bacterium]
MEYKDVDLQDTAEKLKSPNVLNMDEERLDVRIDGRDISKADQVVIMAHGFGTDLHERGLFDQIAEKLTKDNQDRSVVRFSYSGFGESEGSQKVKSLDTMAEDFVSVYDYIKANSKRDCQIDVIGFSLGCNVVSKACLALKEKPYQALIINPAQFEIKDSMQEYFKARPQTVIDEDGVWNLKRSDGSVSYVGEEFWKSIDDPEELRGNLVLLAAESNTVLIRAMNDDVVDMSESFSDVPFMATVPLSGDHNYSKPENRKMFLETVWEMLD